LIVFFYRGRKKGGRKGTNLEKKIGLCSMPWEEKKEKGLFWSLSE